MRFSANLGFLWTELSLPDAIRAAAKAGFDAVECHWPYEEDAGAVRAALDETGLPMLGLNTRRGDVAGGENGLSALVGREDEARAAIDEGLAYGAAIGAKNLHVMAGFASGAAARDCFLGNLRYASAEAAKRDMTILIEPLNPHDAPGYFHSTVAEAAGVIADLGLPNVKLMFDCYHVGRTEGDVIHKLRAHVPIIGHIQFAGVPDRGRPDVGELNYTEIFAAAAALGWDQPLGAEYKPQGPTEPTLGWMAKLKTRD